MKFFSIESYLIAGVARGRAIFSGPSLFLPIQLAIFLATTGLGVDLALVGSMASAQQPGIPALSVQLPTVRFFDIRTAVSVPDGGTMNLGGVSRSGSFRNSVGYPGRVPGIGRPFRNQAIGGFNLAGRVSLNVKIISWREMDEDVTGEALWRQQSHVDPNGSPAVQSRADFLSRNMGRR